MHLYQDRTRPVSQEMRAGGVRVKGWAWRMATGLIGAAS